jgi:hypothetical protein
VHRIRRRPRSITLATALASAMALGVAALPGAASAQPDTANGPTAGTIEVLYSGLHNVRKVTWDPRLNLAVVAEAGQNTAPCIGDPANGCFTKSGSVFAYSPLHNQGRRVVTGLPALLTPPQGIAGISEVTPSGADAALAVFGCGCVSPERDVHGPAARPLGQVARGTLPDQVDLLADLVTFEERNNPDGGVVESNPFGIVPDSAGGFVVTDAAANDVLQVGRDGRIRVLFVPPPVQYQGALIEPVPDAIVRGADGAYYVGELSGAPFPVGAARVWRVVPGQAARLVSGGFTMIIDLAVDRAGRLLVLELAERGLLSGDRTGRLVRIEPNGSHTVLARDGLVNPGGVDVAPNGDIYLTNRATGPDAEGGGQLLRIRGAG